MDEDIDVCPKCGKDAGCEYISDQQGYYIRCMEQDCGFYTQEYETIDEARVEWAGNIN